MWGRVRNQIAAKSSQEASWMRDGRTIQDRPAVQGFLRRMGAVRSGDSWTKKAGQRMAS